MAKILMKAWEGYQILFEEIPGKCVPRTYIFFSKPTTAQFFHLEEGE